MILKVTVRCKVDTVCPQGGADRNEVRVNWRPDPARGVVLVEQIHLIVARYRRKEMYCEDLAQAIATDVMLAIDYPVTVVIEQRKGHGVTAEAVAKRVER